MSGRRIPGIISREEFDQILRKASRTAPSGLRNRAALLLMWDAGLRVSEVCDLAPGDVSLKAATIAVRHGKGDRARVVPAPDSALSAVEAWLRARGRGGSWLLCTVTGRRRLNDRYVRAMLARYSTRAGVFKTVRIDGQNVERPINPHMLRHSYATRCLRDAGLDIDELQELLGHVSVTTTRIYTHVDNAAVAERRAGGGQDGRRCATAKLDPAAHRGRDARPRSTYRRPSAAIQGTVAPLLEEHLQCKR
jgi:site-specific recombinase XerD